MFSTDFTIFCSKFGEYHMISYILLESMVWVDTGPLQTINIP